MDKKNKMELSGLFEDYIRNKNTDNVQVLDDDNYEIIKSEWQLMDRLESLNVEKYVAHLFLQYSKYVEMGAEKAIDYLRENEDYRLIAALNPEFVKYIELINKSRQFYMNFLYKIGVDFISSNTIELDKGEYDTCITEENTSISRYAYSNNQRNSIIYRNGNTVYRVCDDGDISEIEKNSTFILHNPYSLREVFSTINMLAGTDNELIISVWGFLSETKNRENATKDFDEIKAILAQMNICEYESLSENLENLFCETVRFSTKEIKEKVLPYKLLTYADKKVIDALLVGAI